MIGGFLGVCRRLDGPFVKVRLCEHLGRGQVYGLFAPARMPLALRHAKGTDALAEALSNRQLNRSAIRHKQFGGRNEHKELI